MLVYSRTLPPSLSLSLSLSRLSGINLRVSASKRKRRRGKGEEERRKRKKKKRKHKRRIIPAIISNECESRPANPRNLIRQKRASILRHSKRISRLRDSARWKRTRTGAISIPRRPKSLSTFGESTKPRLSLGGIERTMRAILIYLSFGLLRRFYGALLRVRAYASVRACVRAAAPAYAYNRKGCSCCEGPEAEHWKRNYDDGCMDWAHRGV